MRKNQLAMNYVSTRRLLVAALLLASLTFSMADTGTIPAKLRIRGADDAATTISTHTLNERRRRRRRIMQQQRRRRHYSYPNSYQQQQQQHNSSQRKRHYTTRHTQASLSDVLLCYAFALGWSVWFLSAFLNTDLMRYAQSNSVLVHGNVREVSIEDDSLGTGIPTYHALIDYIITVRRERDESKIQVRKSFQTQHLLQQGFANVELLVLPEEPTSSVLKEDWQREVAAQEQAEEDLVSIGGFEDIGIFGGDSNYGGRTAGTSRRTWERGENFQTTFSRVDIWAKRASLAFSAIMVTAALIGAVQTVHRIPDESTQLVGWVLVVVGAVFLWPLSMFVLNVVSTCQRLGRLPTEKSGIILKCDTNAQNVDNDTQHYKQHFDPDQINGRHLDRVTNTDLFNQLKTPKQGNITAAGQQNNVMEQSMNSDNDSAAYFVKLPSHKDGTKKNLDDSSMSTISANSEMSKNRRGSIGTT